jgi:hypothetical protein
MKRQRDILDFSLHTLKIGEEVFCTLRAYTNIAPRIEQFQHANPSCRFKVRQWDGLAHIRRTR